MTQQSPDGVECRLENMSTTGYNNIVEYNSFGGNAGSIADYDSWFDGGLIGVNDPEVMLEEGSYAVLFAGPPGGDLIRRAPLVIPNIQSSPIGWANSNNPTGAGLVVSILAAFSSNGSPESSLAGEWFPVAQQVSLVGNTLELLMEDPLPQMPAGGYYVIEVVRAVLLITLISTIRLT